MQIVTQEKPSFTIKNYSQDGVGKFVIFQLLLTGRWLPVHNPSTNQMLSFSSQDEAERWINEQMSKFQPHLNEQGNLITYISTIDMLEVKFNS